MAALIGKRALEMVRESLGFQAKAYLFSDSQCVLTWIQSGKTLEKFVANRIREIAQSMNTDFRYVSTDENPADLGTRGQTVEGLSQFWWEGPQWLSDEIDKWPKWEVNEKPDKKDLNPNPNHFVEALAKDRPQPASPFGIDIARHSSYMRLLRVTAYCARFINYARKTNNVKDAKTLTIEELQEARKLWDRYMQEWNYSELLQSLKDNKKHPLIRQLGTKLDQDGIIRCYGRLTNIEFNDQAKYPVLLPSKCRYVELAIQYANERLGHAGVSQSLARTREDYWIIRGRSSVSSTIHKYHHCRRYDGGPYALPEMPELPTSRVQRSILYTHTGLDYFGLLFVKSSKETAKVWVALFACLVTRAIHLEVVENMTAEHFIYAFGRFCAFRGLPKTLLCDNASQFKTVESMLKRAEKTVDRNKIEDYMVNHSVQFNYISALSPWKGGVYERMVQLVKRALRKPIGRNTLTRTQLITVLAEIQYIVNTRPLVYVGGQFDKDSVLTPALLLNMNVRTIFPDTTASVEDIKDTD